MPQVKNELHPGKPIHIFTCFFAVARLRHLSHKCNSRKVANWKCLVTFSVWYWTELL